MPDTNPIETAPPNPRSADDAPLRVGMISMTDPDNPNQLSGMPHRMAAALRDLGAEVVPVLAYDPHASGDDAPFAARAAARIRRAHNRRSPLRVKRIVDDLFPARTADALRARADRCAACIHASLDALDKPVDVLFGVCISTAIARLETSTPIVYYSDATNSVVARTYPRIARRGKALIDTRFELETEALARVDIGAFAAPISRDSAVDEFGLQPDRAVVIPMGAHVTPTDPASVAIPAEPPSPTALRLLIVAADPLRKRVDLAVRAAETLRRAGINATLSVIGPGTKLAHASEAVDFCRPLRLSNPDDGVTHRGLLKSCHLQLLPSLGEAFGIAPVESAHFARPSVVTDAGGLPYVVRHDSTGIVLPVNADHRAWADAIAALVRDPERYKRYSAAAVARARDELNWSAWGVTMLARMRRCLAARAARAARANDE